MKTENCPLCKEPHDLSECPRWREQVGAPGYRLLPVALAPHIKDALTRWTDFQASAWADVMQAQANIDAAAPERSETLEDEKPYGWALWHRLGAPELSQLEPNEGTYERYDRVVPLYTRPAASSSAAPSDSRTAEKAGGLCHKCNGDSITHATFCPQYDKAKEQAAMTEYAANRSTAADAGYLSPIKLAASANSPGLWLDENGTYYATAYPTFGHPDDSAVDRFAAAMKVKMAESRAKGRSGWDNEALCPVERLQSMLCDHVAKGDPVDVGNFAMMLFNRGHRSTAVMAGSHASVNLAADRADQPGFEAWAKQHGGLPLDMAGGAALTDDKTMALPTYKFSRTEIAWRAWANRQPAMGAGSLSEQVHMTNDQSRKYLADFMQQHFKDKTYHRYIENALAVDFAWELARALRMLTAGPTASGAGDLYRVGEFWSSSDPTKKVFCLVMAENIERDEKRADFIRWSKGGV